MDGIRASNTKDTTTLINILKCLTSIIRSSNKIFIGSKNRNWLYRDKSIYYTIKSIYIPINLVSKQLEEECHLDIDSIIKILKGGRIHMKRIILDEPVSVIYLKGSDIKCIKLNYRNFRLVTAELQI